MNKRILKRLLVLCIVAACCVYAIASRKLLLGLDLRGGVQVVAQVDTDVAIRTETDKTVEGVRRKLSAENIKAHEIARTGIDRLEIIGISTLSNSFAGWDGTSGTQNGLPIYRMTMQATQQRTLRETTTIQTIRSIENRLNRLGVSESTIQRHGRADDYEVHIQVPGVTDPERVKAVILATALLEFKLVDGGPFESAQAAMASYGGTISRELEILHEIDERSGGEERTLYYVVRRAALISGTDLKTASNTMDKRGKPAVAFNLTADAGRRFGELTEQNIGRGLAVVLDGVIQSVAEIQERIADNGIIQGGRNGFTSEQAGDLVIVLRSGALPAPVRYMSEQLVGPSLGADSIRAGVIASAVGLVSVSTFVVAYYRMSGVNAVISMLMNLLILLGSMAWLQAPLTLPGIAGVVLTIGVGIDSNVLIFERIREELAAGKTAFVAIPLGFQRVFRTLIDTHFAAMISAAILAMFGTGPVRGFAVTLAIGLLSNLFTSVFVSRTLFECVRQRSAPLSI